QISVVGRALPQESSRTSAERGWPFLSVKLASLRSQDNLLERSVRDDDPVKSDGPNLGIWRRRNLLAELPRKRLDLVRTVVRRNHLQCRAFCCHCDGATV